MESAGAAGDAAIEDAGERGGDKSSRDTWGRDVPAVRDSNLGRERVRVGCDMVVVVGVDV